MNAILSFLILGAVWTTDGTDSLLQSVDRLKLDNVSIRRSGAVTLAPVLAERELATEAAVWQVVQSRAGSVYAATGNQGRLYRIGAGAGEKVFDDEAGEILALCADQLGNVFFATTPGGRLYIIRPGRGPEPFCATGENYVFSLLPLPDGSVLCATGENGRLVLVDTQGKASTIYTAKQGHLTALAWLDEGKEWLVGTSPDGVVYRMTFGRTRDSVRVQVLYDTPLNEVRALHVDDAGRVYIGANSSGEPDSDSSGCRVYCLDGAGVLRWSWTCPDSMIFALARARAGSITVASGGPGSVYELDTLGRFSVIRRLEQAQALSLSSTEDGTWLGTGNPGRLYFSGAGFADSGSLVSVPYDCANPARFGRLSSRATVPAGTSLAFDTRSGNSDEPDSTWSEWTEANPLVGSPSRRFVQWRARFKTTFPNLTPELGRVDVFYRAANLAPNIRKLDVAAAPVDDARKGTSKPTRAITWEASDPDGDSLSYELWFRPEGHAWQKLDADITDARYELDTRGLPDGWYEAKLVASDRPTQGSGAALASEQVARPFLVDNTAAFISHLRAGTADPKTGLCRITFSGSDALSPLAAARVSVNAGPWQAVQAADGIFDSGSETFSCDVTLARGENAVAVWVADAQGNVAVARTFARW
jgi:hypothetical protein